MGREVTERQKNIQAEKIKKYIEKYDLSPDYIIKLSSLEHNKPNWKDIEKTKIYREELDKLKSDKKIKFLNWVGLTTAIQIYYPIDISNISNFFPNYEFSDDEKRELDAIAAVKEKKLEAIEADNAKKDAEKNISEEKIPQWRKDFLYGNTEKDLDDPVSYLNSEFDCNINDIPFIEIVIKNYESGYYSVRKTELDEFITNTKKLIKIIKTTDIPNSLFQGVFIAMFEDNSPYVSIRFDGFDDFLRGLEKFGYEKWWKYQTREFLGYTKDELITLSGEPDHKIEKVSRGKKREEFYYGRYRNRLGNDSYTFRIVLIDGKVDGWNDIEK